MKTEAGRLIIDWLRHFVVAGFILLGWLLISAPDAYAIRLDIKYNTGTAIPSEINTNLSSGNNSAPGSANFKYVTLLSETTPSENSTEMIESYATANTWYSFANVYYQTFSTTAQIQANATGSFKVRSTNASDQFEVELWHYSAAGAKVAKLGNTNIFNGATSVTTRNINVSNAAYTLPAGARLLLQVRFKPSANGRTGRMFCNSSNQSYLNVGIKFNIVSSAGVDGTITGPATTPGTAAVDYKSSQTYVATANSGKNILTFTVDGVSVPAAVGQTTYTYNGAAVTNISANHTIDVQFQVATGTFNVAPGSGGCITVEGFGACPYTVVSPPWAGGTTTAYSAATGTYIFHIVPDAGYGIEQVLVNGADQGVPLGQTTLWATSPITLSNGTTVNLTASFLPYINITSSAGAGGAISPVETTAVLQGQSLTFDITPDNGYRLASITDNGVAVTNPTSTYTITNVTATHNVIATFAPVYSISAIAGPNGSISPIGEVVVDSGASRNFSITPDFGYRVNDVLVDGTSVGAVNSYNFNNVTTNHSIEVSFIEAPVPSAYCAVPAFITTPAPPNVMLMLSVEVPMAGPANPTVTCTGTPSAINYACSSSGLGAYDNTRNYYGLFENYKCYTYSGTGASGLFSPSGAATNHQCPAGTAWSGNMLNWATMLAVDAFRKAFTGGNRVVDTTTDTVLLAAFNNNDWAINPPVLNNAELYMPIAGANESRKIVRQNAGIGFGVCNEGQATCTVTPSGAGEARWPVAVANITADNVYSLRIKACDSTGGVEARCNSTTNKPEGTIQKYMDKMRFALMSYAVDNVRERDGGVLREKMKWVGPAIPNGLMYHDASGNIATCSTSTGCANPEKEVNADGTFVYNPVGAASGNSGLINYINKFAYTSGYKSYDPVSELYYEVVRYFRNQTPSGSNYCNGLSEPNDNFPIYCNATKTNARGWRDPSLYSCSQNFVIAVNDANPHVDKRIPGTSFIADYGGGLGQTAVGDWCGSPRGACDSDFLDGGVQVPVETWTNNVGDYEGLTGKNIGHSCEVNALGVCITPVGNVTKLGRVIQSSKGNSYLVSGLAYYARMSDLRPNLSGKQNLTTYMIDTQEPQGSMPVGPKNMLQLAAKYGGFEDRDNDGKPYSNATCGGVNASPNTLCSEWDADNDGYPDNYFFASDSAKVETSLYKAFASILNRATSGTAAAVANNRSGERGANIIQALFYPQWPNDMGIRWLGDVQALWFYLDPIIKFSGIFEDSDLDKELNLRVDRTPGSDATQVKALWKAGQELHLRTAASRSIYTLLNSGVTDLTNAANAFTTANRVALKPLMDIATLSDANADVIINYVRGADNASHRSRTVTNNGVSAVWKLGDVINSTPQIQGGDPINNYQIDYADKSYKSFSTSDAYKTNNFVYAGSNDGLLHAFRLGQVQRINDPDDIYRIANIIDDTDLGKEEWAFIPSNARPYLKNCSDANYCHQYLVDGTPTLLDAAIYCASGNYWECDRQASSWKSVLIGSMGLGGATRDGNCNETLNPDADATNNTDCIKTPVAGDGFSSYFALDVTAPLSPKFMWEFSDGALPLADRGLGLTTSGPAIVRINSVGGIPAKPVKTSNGRWFAVFASGPTGTIDTATRQFLGRSDQDLKIYVVDLNASAPFTNCATGAAGCNYWVFPTGIKFAFAGSLINSTFDVDKGAADSTGYYSDDIVYIPYTKATLDNSAAPGPYPTAWDKGGILRLITNNDPDPANWFISTLVDNIGPVTRAVDIVQNKNSKKLWVFFGEGRYFFNGDDLNTTRRIFGVADPCYSYDNNHVNKFSTTAAICPALAAPQVCTAPQTVETDISPWKNQTDTPVASLTTTKKGWYICLDTASGTNSAERMTGGISAGTNGVVFYTTFIPSSDRCIAGGVPSQWAVNYSTGGTPPARSMQGKIIMTTSDQPIAKPINIGTAFNQSGNRKLDPTISTQLKGVPPPQPPPTVNQPVPTKRIMNIQER